VSEAFNIDAVVGVGDGGAAQLALRGITPNPAQHELRVSFSLRDSKAASLTLFDVSGRQLASRRVDGMGPGWHSVTLGERSSLPARQQPAGGRLHCQSDPGRAETHDAGGAGPLG
jgi:hypothetical protein